MKPKSKLQIRVFELSSKLPGITDKHKTWAFNKCFSKQAVRSRNTLFCLECGHSWKDKAVLVSTIVGCTCPGCGQELKMKTDYRHACREAEYVGILTTKGGMQVVRIFYVSKFMKKLKKVSYDIDEVMQHWIDQSGDVQTMSINVMGLSHYYDQWVWGSEMQVRPRSYKSCPRYNINPYKIYPEKRILPVIRRNGFKGYFYGLRPHQLFSLILQDSIAETLLKTGYIDMLKRRADDPPSVDEFWPSIKICIRNNYPIKDAGIWLDHLDLLKYFGKDIHSDKYICPGDINAEHVKLIEKKRRAEEKEDLEKRKKQIAHENISFKRAKRKFFKLHLTMGEIRIVPLRSIEDYIREGRELKHCVYTNEYYKKKDSLILSARKGRDRIETVEVSLTKMEVVQSRGINNTNSSYHKDIIKLVSDNITVISKLKSSGRKVG